MTLLFEELVAKGIQSIPERFRAKLKNVAILVEDEPSEEQLTSVGIPKESGDTLLGLYEGVSNLEGGHTHRGFPDRITIFRLPILEEAAREEDIPVIVAETVRHEIAHHFGMDEHEVERAEGRKN
ncbi:MAG: metallopeptidase family protein [Candidatus Jorgensenbacteria bacterium]|nr:metallopeptidase family protein [Candidatus Jorgensenbacteria bacterium]